MPEVAKVGTDMCARARARARKAAPWFGGLPRVKHVRWRSSTGAIQLSHADHCRKDVFNGRRGEPDLFRVPVYPRNLITKLTPGFCVGTSSRSILRLWMLRPSIGASPTLRWASGA